MRSQDPFYVFDARLIDRHIKQGVIAESDLSAFVQALPDRSENAEALNIPPDPEQGGATSASSAL